MGGLWSKACASGLKNILKINISIILYYIILIEIYILGPMGILELVALHFFLRN
jgi:hypothetical protein